MDLTKSLHKAGFFYCPLQMDDMAAINLIKFDLFCPFNAFELNG